MDNSRRMREVGEAGGRPSMGVSTPAIGRAIIMMGKAHL